MYDEEKLKQMDAKNIQYPDGSMHTLDHTILRESVQMAFDKNTLKLKQQEKI